MVRAKYPSSKRSGSRHRSAYAPSSHGSSKMSTVPSSPRGRRSSIDSLYSRDSSYDRLIRPSKYSDMSRHRPLHYGRMVFEAVARLKSRRGSSVKDIAKTLERKYPESLRVGDNTTEKVIATAKKLVRQGKLVKDGSNYYLRKTSSKKSAQSDDDAGSQISQRREKRHSGGKHSHYHRGRSHSRGNGSRSRSRGKRRSRSYSRSRSRKVHRYTARRQKKGRSRNSSARRSLKRGSKRKKKGARKGQTRMATGRRGPHQKRASRARRRVKHSYSRRPKSDKLPDGDSSQNKGWFGGWFGAKGGGETKQQGSDKGSSSKSEKRSKSAQERSPGGEREAGGV